MADLTIFTIGHSNQTMEGFLRLLSSNRIQVLVDVRTSPYSRYSPHFSKDNLKLELKDQGIGYRFAGDYLGGRPDDPDLYKNGVIPDGHADYLNLVDYPAVATTTRYREGIDKLLILAEDNRVAIMCSEGDPQQCHRHHLIAQTLIDADVEVVHIHRDGKLSVAQLLIRQPSLLG
jgi:uncharacterized protein (DUF488 family)